MNQKFQRCYIKPPTNKKILKTASTIQKKATFKYLMK